MHVANAWLLLFQLMTFASAKPLSRRKTVPSHEVAPSMQLLGHSCRPIGQGVAVRTDWLHGENDYCILRNVNSITVEYEMTWTKTEAAQGVYTWEKVDQIYRYAQNHRLGFRGQSIVYYQTSPAWVAALPAQEMRRAIYDHSYNTVKRYPEMESVVVVNEPMATDDSGTLYDWPLYEKLGIEYIVEAFRGARAANPHVQLVLNEYQVEGSGLGFNDGNSNKRDAFLKLVKLLLSKNVPIDAIGFQGHFEVGKVPKDLAQGMKLFTDLGVNVMMTEVDIRVKKNATWKDYRQQAEEYGFIYRTCMMNRKCTVSATTQTEG
jgi:endo-1,4-beta-xylanase